MSISSPFIRRPVATSLIAAAFLLVGTIAYFNLPVAATVTGVCTALWPGPTT